MASSTPKTILISGGPQAEMRQFEDMQTTASTITPGYLVEMNAANEKMIAHATAGGTTGKLFALENPFADTSGKAIDFDWPASSYPKYIAARAGDKLYAWIDTNLTIDKGDPVESSGDGTLREHVADTFGSTATVTVTVGSIVGYAMEDITSTTGAKQRLTIRIA